MPDPKKKYPIYNILDDPNIVEVPNVQLPKYMDGPMRISNVSEKRSVSTEKKGKQNFRSLYQDRGVIKYVDAPDAISLSRSITTQNNNNQKHFAIYKFDGPDGVSATFDKNTNNTQKQILKFGDAAERLTKRKNKKLNRVEKRVNRKMDKM